MIQITFTPESLAESAIIAEAMNRIMAVSAQQLAVTPPSGLIAGAQEEPAAAPAPKQTRARKPAPAAAQDSAPATGTSETTTQADPTPTATTAETEGNAVAEPSTPEAPAASTASSTEPELSLETVRAKLTAISKAGKAEQVKGLLVKLGVTNLTAVPKEAYAQLVADAEAL